MFSPAISIAKTDTTTNARVLIGIDISKNRHEVLIAVPGKMRRRRRMTVLNTADDYQRLIEILRSFGLPVTIWFEGWLIHGKSGRSLLTNRA